MKQLASALASLQRGDAAAALAALLDAWRACPAPKLASLVEDVSRRAARGRPAITGKSLAALDATWRAIEAAADPADLDRLVAALPKAPTNGVSARIAILGQRGPDPRVAAGIIALLVTPPDVKWVRGNANGMWDDLFAGLAAAGDPRTREAIRAIPWIADDRAPSPWDADKQRGRTAKRAVAAATTAPEPGVLDVEAERLCEAIAGALAPAELDGDALLARIYADPHDLELRRVYADYLLEQQDPRGELIVTQLARPLDRKPTKREEKLVKLHEREWTGALGPNLTHTRFEHGFLYGAWLDAIVLDPVLATVVELHANIDTPEVAALLVDPVWRSLRTVKRFSWAGLDGLLAAAKQPLAFTSIAVGDTLRTPPALTRLPALRVFELQYYGEVSEQAAFELVRAPVFATLDTFAIAAWRAPRVWIEAFLQARTRAFRLDNVGSWATVWLERDPEPTLVLEAEHAKYALKAFTELATWWPKELIPRVRVVADATWPANDRDPLLAAARVIDPDATITSA